MKIDAKILLGAAWAVAICCTSCGNDDNSPLPDDPTAGGTIASGETLRGNITRDTRLVRGGSYRLSGGVHVKAGAVLTIEPGVRVVAVDDEQPDYILVEQGARILAEGTAGEPIVMTSESERAAWGGIHICGYAHTNAGEGVLSEIGNAPYGGDDDADDSGVLRYIRLEYTGFALDEEHEANGVSFYGVGNGTTVAYLQAYRGSDDGFEFFGGSVDVKHLVATDCSDDSFDWTEGWNGRAQFLVATQQAVAALGYDCDCLMECDNNGSNFAASPVSHPRLSNLTLAGNASADNKRGVRLRAGTRVGMYNALVTGKTQCLTVETDETEQALRSGTSELRHVASSTPLDSKQSIYTAADFAAGEGNSDDYMPALTDGYVGTLAGGAVPEDDFFEAAPYKGAVPSDADWTSGWTRR